MTSKRLIIHLGYGLNIIFPIELKWSSLQKLMITFTPGNDVKCYLSSMFQKLPDISLGSSRPEVSVVNVIKKYLCH
jgi:hypothetical protein